MGTFLENKVHWKSKLSKYGIHKRLSPIFVFFNENFFWKDSADFWLSKMALKIRILLYLTFNTKSSQIPRTFLWPFSLTFGLVYSTLNSANLSWLSEVTLWHMYFLHKMIYSSWVTKYIIFGKIILVKVMASYLHILLAYNSENQF